MATRDGTIANISDMNTASLITWAGLQPGDDGEPVQWLDYADRCAQVSGTFGVGGSLTLQGSNDGTNWSTMSDPQGNPLTFTASKLEQVLELPRYVRPVVTAGDGTTNLSTTIVMRRGFK